MGKTTETHRIKVRLRAVRKLYGDTLAIDFGPIQFVREYILEGKNNATGFKLSRTYVNSIMRRIQKMFRWASGEGLLPAERDIREEYKQLHELAKSQKDEPFLQETQRSIQSKELRHSEIGEQLHGLENLELDEADVFAALGRFDEVWKALSPRERSRIIHLVVERVGMTNAWLQT